MSAHKGARIRALNDQLRRYLIGGHVLLTDSLQATGPENVRLVIEAVSAFDDFDDGNDPYGEHDFGSVEVEGQRYLFQIAYYAPGFEAGTEDASDPDVCIRVMTIMLAADY